MCDLHHSWLSPLVCQSPKLRLVRPFPRSGSFSTRMSPMGVPFSSDSLTESEIGVQPTADMRAVDDAYLDIEREPRTFIHVKRAKRFDPVG